MGLGLEIGHLKKSELRFLHHSPDEIGLNRWILFSDTPIFKMIWLVQNLQILTGDAQVQGGAPVSVLSWFATEITWD